MASRIFIAADLDENIRDAIYRHSVDLFSNSKDFRITPRENLHITIKFVGNTPEGKIEEIKSIIREAASFHRKFEYSLERHMGAFPHKGRARIAYVDIAGGKHRFCDLYGSLEEGLVAAGVKKESRDFHPHITAARMKVPLDIGKTISVPLSFVKTPLCLDSVSLYESILDGRGARYVNIGRFSLK